MTDAMPGRCNPAALKLIADYWVLRIVEELHQAGRLRFSALQRELGGASPATLSNRLRRLEEEGLVQRDRGSAGKLSVSYSLSEQGLKVMPVIRAINSFAHRSEV